MWGVSPPPPLCRSPNPKPQTLPTAEIFDPQPQPSTPNTNPQTPNLKTHPTPKPKPQTPNSQHQAPNRKSQTLHPNRRSCGFRIKWATIRIFWRQLATTSEYGRSAAERRGNNSKKIRTLTSEPRPESGRVCCIRAIFARQAALTGMRTTGDYLRIREVRASWFQGYLRMRGGEAPNVDST